MCRPRGGINLLPTGVTLKGVIVRERHGYRFHWNGDMKILLLAAKNMREQNINTIFEPLEMFTGEREELRARIKCLNKEAGLPGVNAAQEAA